MIGPGTTLNGRFLLQKELGRGGMGAVYSATDQVLQRSVAIKLLRDQRAGEELSRRLRLEAQIAARLLHDNIVRIYDFGEAEGTSYLVMEQVDGVGYNKRWRDLPLAERLTVLAGVAEALDYAHHQGVIHRDVKPGNVLLTSTDVPKLSDFGLSLLAEQDDAGGVVRGTPLYMSPEQARGRKLTHKTDLYSLGVMLYESATGSVPFSGVPLSVMAQHANNPPPPILPGTPDVSPELERLILSLLAKRPEDRPPGGLAVAAALRDEAARLRGETVAPGEATPAEAEAAGPMFDVGALAELGEGRKAEPAGARKARRAAKAAPARAAAISGVEAADLASSPLVRKMLRTILAEPVLISPEERYLHGYYLAYLLVGSRRAGMLGRKKLDRANADRARLILAMTYALNAPDSEAAVAEAAQLFEQGIEVRPALSPAVLAKFLARRETPAQRRTFRRFRKAIQEASPYVREHMTDEKGAVNVGMIPRSLEDLARLAPRREVGDELVERWNRLADAWREQPEVRDAVLRYVGGAADRDSSAAVMWPEVVYPLVEIARWQRSRESPWRGALRFLTSRVLRIPDPTERLHRTLKRHLSGRVVEQLDRSALQLERVMGKGAPDEPADADEAESSGAERMVVAADSARVGAIVDDVDRRARDGRVSLVDLDPIRVSQSQLHELWKEGVQALREGAGRPGAEARRRHMPLGPYRLAVVPSIRGASAGQVVIQGMPGKQVELLTPSLRSAGFRDRPLLAAWLYDDGSLLLSHVDFRNSVCYVLWDAPRGRQSVYTDPAILHRDLEAVAMEIPEAVDRALSRRFKPQGGAR
ncbi:serine/threonine-protein kinase [Paludisphaera sp.]|uniref:serine/threonine-protein kinase n=1 Tax=Paludisphaera sp. TaxID=2017432 RepID=UPI00301D45EE